jgi:mono/diheme cytochrome c family protein
MKILRWVGIALASLLGLVVIAVGAAYALSGSKLKKTYDVPAETLAVAGDSATVARGEHLVKAVSVCVGCHTESLAGDQFIDDAAFARVAATNLTPGKGGVGSRHTDATWERAIRHGISVDGRALAIMPSHFYNAMSNEDLAAVIAYLKTLPPVEKEHKPFSAGPVARMLIAANKLPFFAAATIDHAAPHKPAPPAGATSEYGSYLVGIGACRECHGPNLSGGPLPGEPPDGKKGSNLTPTGLRAYDEGTFVTAIRTGARPAGAPIDTLMPWKLYGRMTDDELKAVWRYLQTLPPKEYGER